jgi:hypothetical protein
MYSCAVLIVLGADNETPIRALEMKSTKDVILKYITVATLPFELSRQHLQILLLP